MAEPPSPSADAPASPPHDPGRSFLTPVVAALCALAVLIGLGAVIATVQDGGRRTSGAATSPAGSVAQAHSTASPVTTPSDTTAPSDTTTPPDNTTPDPGVTRPAMPVVTVSGRPVVLMPDTLVTDQRAPGAGTPAGIVAHLTAAGFVCTQEQTALIASHLCSRTDRAPRMYAYVGGPADGGLGRLSLSVLDPATPETRDLQTWLATQFLSSDDVQPVLGTLAQGTTESPANGRVGLVAYRGFAGGTMVLAVTRWLPPGLAAPVLQPSQDAFSAALRGRGWVCAVNENQAQSCELSVGDASAGVTSFATLPSDGLTLVSVQVRRRGSAAAQQQVLARALADVEAVLGTQGTQLRRWLAAHPGAAVGMSDGLFVRHLPPGGASVPGRSAVLFGSPCWVGALTAC